MRTSSLGALQAPTANGWIEDAQYQLPTGNSFHQLVASWHVPAAPIGSYSAGQTFYSFPGLEDINDPSPAPFIIQPVIQYGSNGMFGGSFWTAASWRCNSGSSCLYGTPINISPNDSVFGSVSASACVNGTCTWTISTVDATKGTRSDWTADDVDHYIWATGGAMEVYGLTSCNQFPSNGVFFTGISLHDKNGSAVTPTWTSVVQSGVTPSCSYGVAFTNTTVNVLANPVLPPPPLAVSITGPASVKPHASCTWNAIATGGTSPYGAYAWKSNSTPIGDGSSTLTYTVGTTGFTLHVTVTDHLGSQASNTKSVTVSSTAPNCPQ